MQLVVWSVFFAPKKKMKKKNWIITTLHNVFFPQSSHVAPKVAISHNMI